MWPCILSANLSNTSSFSQSYLHSLFLYGLLFLHFFETVNSYFNSENVTSYSSLKTEELNNIQKILNHGQYQFDIATKATSTGYLHRNS